MAGLSRGCQYRLVRGRGNNAESSGPRDMGGTEREGWMRGMEGRKTERKGREMTVGWKRERDGR